MRYAIIDIGSNTVKMSLYDVDVGCTPSLILTESRTAGLLSFIRRNKMSKEGIELLIEIIATYKLLSEKLKCDIFFCYSAACLRNTNNKLDVMTAVTERVGINIDIISGETEALLSFSGLKFGLGDTIRSGIMIDMGGGSTELVGFIDGLAVHAVTLDFGCLSLYNKFVKNILPQKDELKKIKHFVDERLNTANWLSNWNDALYTVGGTARSLGKLHSVNFNIPYEQYGYTIPSSDIEIISDKFKQPGRPELDIMISLLPDRLHTVIPGIIALSRITKIVNPTHIIISESGLREGYLLDKLSSCVRISAGDDI